jgi:hypothetical protein
MDTRLALPAAGGVTIDASLPICIWRGEAQGMPRFRLALLALLSLGACAPFSPIHKPLASADRGKLQEVDVRVVVAQESFMFSAQAPGVSAATGRRPGRRADRLVGAAVAPEGHERGGRQSIVGPLLGYDYRVEAGLGPRTHCGGHGPSAFPLKIALLAGARGHAAEGRAGGPHRRHPERARLPGAAAAVRAGARAWAPSPRARRRCSGRTGDKRAARTARPSVIYQTPIGGTERAPTVVRRLGGQRRAGAAAP